VKAVTAPATKTIKVGVNGKKPAAKKAAPKVSSARPAAKAAPKRPAGRSKA